MSPYTDHMRKWLDDHPRLKQWLWFAALWLAGLFAVTAATYPIKLIINAGR